MLSKLMVGMAIVLVLIVACGGDAGDTDGGDDGGTDTATTGGDGGTTGGDDGSPPPTVDGDFSIPAPDGINEVLFEMQGSEGQTVQVQLAYDQDDFDRIVSFYDDWYQDVGGNWSRSESGQVVIFTNTDNFSQVSISRDFEYVAGEELITYVLLVDAS